MRAVAYSAPIQQVVQRLLNHDKIRRKRNGDARFVRGVRDQCRETGKISYNQMRILGCIYKRLFQRDVYVHHNWPIW